MTACTGGSPYKRVSPMQHYENTASERGSRVDGFNPEYGSPTIPTVETLREVMDEKDLWPINKGGMGFIMMAEDSIWCRPCTRTLPAIMALPLPSKSLPPRSGGRCDELKIDLGSLELYSKFGYGDNAAHHGVIVLVSQLPSQSGLRP
ncbi:MAG: hypothetical protein ACLUIE_10700 [Parabacteroides merdae]